MCTEKTVWNNDIHQKYLHDLQPFKTINIYLKQQRECSVTKIIGYEKAWEQWRILWSVLYQ